MSDCPHDLNLLYGILALQLNFIDRDQLIKAMHTWVSDKSKPLGDILVELGFLSRDRQQRLADLVQEHLKQHDNDTQRGLAALDVLESVRKDLEGLPDQVIQQTLSIASARAKGTDTHATKTFSIDEELSAGQRFRIVSPHAEGGLGKVWVAWDEELHRQVALKELKPDRADDEHSRARFVMEAEVNGGLEHPGIVPVYAVGEYADGRPFYAMRFIRGVTLSDAIAEFHKADKGRRDPGERSLEFRKLLRRFVDVCQAIHYAHGRGVLHRDLKPGNIMLGTHGETLVVDWGLSKVSAPGPTVPAVPEPPLVLSTGSSSALTQMRKTFGTPAYMSPEQAEGFWGQVGPTSDVYSLGATLYELLTGRQAFQGDTTDVLKKVKANDFAAPREVNPTVPKPLNAVCLKAMSASQQDRYQTPVALAEDIEQWLADEPVSAHRDSVLERCYRWLRHHRSLAITGALALVAIAIVSVIAVGLIMERERQAQAARAVAVQRFRQAREAVDAWLTGTSDILQYYPDADSVRAKLLEQAATDYQAFVDEQADGSETMSEDVDMRLEHGRTLLRLADVQRELRQDSAAQESYRRSATALEQIANDNPGLLDAQLEYARAATKLGTFLSEMGDDKAAEQVLERAVSTLRKFADDPSADPRVHELLGIALTDLAVCVVNTPGRKSVPVLFRQAIGELEEAAGAVYLGSQAYEALADARHLYGRYLTDVGQYAEASQQIGKSVLAYEKLAKIDFKHLAGQAEAEQSQAILLRVRGEWTEELQYRNRIIDAYATLAESLPSSPIPLEKGILARINRGQLLARLNQLSEAEKELTSDLVLLEKHEEDVDPFEYWYMSAICNDALGEITFDRGQNDYARRGFEGAFASLTQLCEARPDESQYRQRLAVTESHLAQLLAKLGDMDAAVAHFDAAISALAKVIDESPERLGPRNALAFVYHHCGRAHGLAGDAVRAKEMFVRAKDTWEALVKQQETVQAVTPQYMNDYAWFLVTCMDVQVRDPDRALELARRVLTITDTNPSYHATLGVAQFRLEGYQDAETSFQNAMERRGEGSAAEWYFLGMTQWKLDQKEQARVSFQKGDQWMTQWRPENLELKQIRGEAATLLGVE